MGEEEDSVTGFGRYCIDHGEAGGSIVDRTANIDIDGEDQVTEDDPGFDLTINDDDDNEDGVADFLGGFPDDELFVDDDLVEVTLASLIPQDMGFEEDYFKVAFDSSLVRLWFNQDKSEGPDGDARVTVDTKFDESDGSFTLWIEGVGFGAGEVALVWYESALVEVLGLTGSVFDTFSYTTIGIDVDIDSDNDDVIQHSAWEDELEDNLYGLGKLLKENVTPLKYRVSPVVHSDSTLTFDYNADSEAGNIILGTAPDHLGEWIRPGDTLFKRDFVVDAEGWVTIWVHVQDVGGAQFSGEAPGSGGLDIGDGTYILDRLGELKDQGKPEETIEITLKSPNGGESSDEVKYISVKPKSILWEIQTRPELRHAFVSKAVYGFNPDNVDDPSDLPYDLPNYGLEWLDDKKLDEYELPVRVRKYLNKNIAHAAKLGLIAGLYKDYVGGGPESYIVVFGGTNFEKYDDWATNFTQGYIGGGEHFVSAMSLAEFLLEDLPDSPKVTSPVVLKAAGHSLGGGLASAASIWAGLQAVIVLIVPD